MNINDARNLARAEMDKYGLMHWKIEISNSRGAAGRCIPYLRTIELSSFWLGKHTDAKILDTIRHEIAHALTPGAKHGDRWKAVCVRIGATPKARFKAEVEDFRWQGVCPCGKAKHGQNAFSQKMLSRYCRSCLGFLSWKKDGQKYNSPLDGKRQGEELFKTHVAVAASRPAARVRRVTTPAPMPFDRGFTDIEALFNDPED